ncbi:MAG: hypothetical protein A2Y04_05135 [Omnitrophica WOR_2 bacterium GWC2_45_7]|nr:MAG: hypothetical protein A2Y04_05135 [Omnitrophica WOR_2 bacterium GWC2_45_7]
MEIVHDAIGYEDLGTMLAQDGWLEYFRTGPHREPLYPFLISLSMRLAPRLSLSYQTIQALIQVAFLFLTQFLAARLMRRLGIRPVLILLTTLYIGFSPALVNSAFSLFSEIISYPLVLGIILIGSKSFDALLKNEFKGIQLFFYAVSLGILFSLTTSVKGAFEYLSLFLMLPFVLLILKGVFSRQRVLCLKAFLFFLTSLIITQSITGFYKMMNQRHNGYYTVTDRGAWMLYGAAEKRIQQLSPRKIAAGLAFSAGEGACLSAFSEEECNAWAFQTSDFIGMTKLLYFHAEGFSPKETNARLLALATQDMRKNPVRYLVATTIESTKMFFWESTRIGFVTYPPALNRLFNFSPFKNGLRFIMSFLTMLSFIYLCRRIVIHRKKVFASPTPETGILLFIFIQIIGFIGLYSLFSILTRYAFPIVPLYLILIACMLEALLQYKKHNTPFEPHVQAR